MKPVVLVVDDESDVALSLAMLLDREYEVLTASTLKGALEILKTATVSVVILDLNLTDSRGKATAEAIHEADPTLSVVVYSGYLEDLPEGVADEMVTKASPTQVEDLMSALQRAPSLRKVALMYGPLKKEIQESKELVQELKTDEPKAGGSRSSPNC